MATRETQVSPNSQAIDLSVPRPKPLTEASTSQSCSSDLRVPKPAHQHHSAPEGSSNTKKKKLNNAHNLVDGKNGKRRQVNIFKKHKLKYQYLNKKHRHEKSKHTSDSGQFGSSSMQGSSSTTSMDKRSTNDSTSSLYTSSSPSSGTSDSPLNLASSENQGSSTTSTATTGNDSPMCMMLRHAVPLVVMMQGQLQSSQNDGVAYSETTLYKCNMCSMFSNNLTDVLSHVKSNHATVHYCFVCSQFHSTRTEFDRHRNVCATAHQAFQQIVDNHYMNQQSNPQNSSNSGGTQDQALNLSIAGNVAMRAAQMIHSKKGRQKKIKKLQKCTYCKKAFFGRFYLQRHLRSHTGEKLCHCTICGKGFYEWRNLRNHMSRFHNSSQSSESGGQSKSVSPNITSDSDQRNSNRGGAYHTGTSGSSGSTSGIQADKSSSGSGGSGFVGGSGGSQTTNSSKSSETSGNPQRGEGQSVALSRSMEFTHPNDLTNTWTTPSASAAAEHMISSEDYNRSSSAASNSYISKSNIKISSSPGNASSVNSGKCALSHVVQFVAHSNNSLIKVLTFVELFQRQITIPICQMVISLTVYRNPNLWQQILAALHPGI